MFKYKLTILILISLYFIAFASDTILMSRVIKPVVDRDYFPSAIDLISNAKKSIYISMFATKECDKLDSLIVKIIEASTRNVQIKILLENNIVDNPKLYDSLKNVDNITIALDSPDKITHNKIMIVDNEFILIGSTNWTCSSMEFANEANVIIKDTIIADYFQKYIDTLFVDSSRDIKPFDNFTGKIVPLIDRQYFDSIYVMIKNAKSRVWVMVYGFKLSEGEGRGDILASEIINANIRDVDTKVILEKNDFDDQINKMNAFTIKYFNDNGINAKFDNEKIITHAKVIIIDNAVILGATNWSYGGLEEWHNTDIVIRNKDILNFFINYYKKIFYDR